MLSIAAAGAASVSEFSFTSGAALVSSAAAVSSAAMLSVCGGSSGGLTFESVSDVSSDFGSGATSSLLLGVVEATSAFSLLQFSCTGFSSSFASSDSDFLVGVVGSS